MNASDYVHLHNHTQYSLLDGLTKVPALIDRVKELGMQSIAMTDHGTMSGAIEFYKAANEKGIKPIIGMEAYIAPRTHLDKTPEKDRQYYHLTVLAMNNQGYKNLMRLSTIANLDGFYYKPRIDHALLEKYSEGLIILSGCIGGEVSDALRQDQYDQAKATATWYKKVFGDRYYIELMDSGSVDHPKVWAEQTKVNNDLLKLAKELDIPAVITCDAHYLMHEDQEAHEILLCVQTGSFLTDEGRFSLENFELHVADPNDIIKRWGSDHPELITNTSAIANRCQVDIELGSILIPKFPQRDGKSEKEMLEEEVWQGLAWRYGGKKRPAAQKLTVTEGKKILASEVVERASYELEVVDKMGFNGYYLIVSDFINWGKDRGIVFGPGRGSAAGSIMAYAMRITELDPLKYDLLFERFLNPDRISMPDIDIDIQDSRRDEVIQYCVEKYGRDRVANIVTFGRMAARNSVRDVARVLQVPYSEADRMSKMIPPPVQGRHIPLAVSLKENQDLKTENENPTSARVFELATKLEGTIRSHGVHAAGVVIAPSDIVEYTPLEMAQKGVIATQYSMGPIEELGLLKMDFLGLSNLTIIKNALRIIKRVNEKDIDISTIPLDDSKTFKLLAKGESKGIFQLESSGMRRYLKELKPSTFEDIVAMVALYRPGPLTAGLTDKYIARKNGREQVSYDHETMKPALKNTYGVMVYQEQFMQIVKDMCGFTGGEADTLRKAVGKKKRDLMVKMKDQIIKGAVANKVPKNIAEKFWTDLEGFADYAFNKSHAACYGLIAYQTAYLKAHYPAAFMAALMTSDYDDIDRLAIEITECKHMGVEVLPPDVNESFHEFAVVPGKKQIRFGLDAIKNVGHGAVEEIIRARSENGGRLNNLEDYCQNVNPRIVNKKSLESLIKAGALDAFGERNLILANMENILAFSTRVQKDQSSGQVGLFGSSEIDAGAVVQFKLSEAALAFTQHEQLIWERELLGLYLSRNPLSDYEKILTEMAVPISSLDDSARGKQLIVGGVVSDIREITTKKGDKMAFIRIEDLVSEIELVLFPKAYLNTKSIFVRDSVVLVLGKIGDKSEQDRGDELKVLVDSAQPISLEQARAYEKNKKSFENKLTITSSSGEQVYKPRVAAEPKVYIRLEDSSNQEALLSLKEKLDIYTGETEVVLVTGPQDSKQIIKLPQKITVHEASLRDLAQLFGSTNLVVK